MLLSILIPVYNYDVTALVGDLHAQATTLGVGFEIIVLEDGSTEYLPQNAALAALTSLHYEVLKKNIGRAAIRNRLADKAKGKYLLFLDCDTGIASDDFLKRYLSLCQPDCVVSGGCIYHDNCSPQTSLAVKYGSKRERFSTKQQHARSRFCVFTTPNFLIEKTAFEKLRFDENIRQYGHEDTIFGLELQKAGYTLTFVDNPVYHNGLDTNIAYLKKNETALKTLLSIYLSGKYPQLQTQSQLLHFYLKTTKWRLNKIISFFFVSFKPLIEKNLTGKKPSLFLFDCYKIGFFCHLGIVHK